MLCSHGIKTSKVTPIKNTKYNSLSEWQKANPKAYAAARKRKLLDKICKEFGWTRQKPSGYWNLKTCKEDASKYSSRREWKLKSGAAYQSASKNKWIDECCEHMTLVIHPNGYWTLEKCKEDAAKYKYKYEWQKAPKSGYYSAKRNGWLDECYIHMEQINKPNGYWTPELCKESALKYNKKSDWKKFDSAAYRFARKNNLFNECTEHMLVFHGQWSDIEKCKVEALDIPSSV